MDVDGVLIDFAAPALAFLASVGRRKTYDQIKTWDIFEGDEELEDEFKETVVSQPGYCYSLEPLPGAIDFVRRARERYDVQVITTPYDVPYWFDERKSSLVDNFGMPRSAITFTHHKEFIEGDALVEDKVENVVRWYDNWKGRRRCLAMVVDQPWNRVELPYGINRAVDFEDLSDWLKEFGLPAIY